jgi:hypothetical protein
VIINGKTHTVHTICALRAQKFESIKKESENVSDPIKKRVNIYPIR